MTDEVLRDFDGRLGAPGPFAIRYTVYRMPPESGSVRVDLCLIIDAEPYLRFGCDRADEGGGGG